MYLCSETWMTICVSFENHIFALVSNDLKPVNLYYWLAVCRYDDDYHNSDND